jgi:hypothetical protein
MSLFHIYLIITSNVSLCACLYTHVVDVLPHAVHPSAQACWGIVPVHEYARVFYTLACKYTVLPADVLAGECLHGHNPPCVLNYQWP